MRAVLSPCVPFNPASRVPYYLQIYEGFRDAILSGQLRAGQRLPSSRALAIELGVSRLPVVNAFDQLLHEGYVEGKIGSGTFVKDSIPDELGRVRAKPVTREKTVTAPAWNFREGVGPFRVSQPALDAFPNRIWARLVARHAKHFSVESMAYCDPVGNIDFREAIADYLRTARAVSCEAHRIIIVSGSQMALQVCARGLLSSTDVIAMEEPGYPGARDALLATGAKLAPIQLDEQGIDVAALHRAGAGVRAVYVTPSHQYPLGMLMTASRRIQLLDWATRNKTWIIEDDYDSEYRYASRPLASLQGMDKASRVIYIGTFSKVLFPSLRLGYIVVPEPLFQSFATIRETLDIFSPTLFQHVLKDFIREGHFARHLRKMRALYELRRDALLRSIHAHAKNLLSPFNTDAGLHIAAFLPAKVDDVELVRQAIDQGIFGTALSTCYAGKTRRSGLILGFGGFNERAMQSAMQKFATLIRAMK